MDFPEKANFNSYLSYDLDLRVYRLIVEWIYNLMNKQTKSVIIGGLVGGIVYASIMAGFDYIDGQNFRSWRFILNVSMFEIFIGFMTKYNIKKQSEKENNND